MSEPSSREDLLRELQRLSASLEHPPRKSELQRYSEYTVEEFLTVFSSIANARQAAGVESPRTPVPTSPVDQTSIKATTQPPSHDALLEDIYLILSSVGKPMTENKIREYGIHEPEDIVAQFGSLQAAAERVEEGLAGEVYATEDFLTHLQEVGNLVDRTPTATDILRVGLVPLRKYSAYFDSWACALKKAGFPTNGYTPVVRNDLLDSFHEVCTHLGRPPLPDEIAIHTPYSKFTYVRRFGNWGGLLRASEWTCVLSAEAFQNQSRLLLTLELRRVAQLIDGIPTIEEVHTHGQYEIATYQREFSTWDTALTSAGLTTSDDQGYQSHPSFETVQTALTTIGANYVGPVTFADIIEADSLDPDVFFDTLQSLDTALQVCDLPFRTAAANPDTEFMTDCGSLVFEDRLQLDEQLASDEILLTDLDRVADETTTVPRPLEVDILGAFSCQTYRSEYDSWVTAVDQSATTLEAGQSLPQTNRKEILGRLLDTLERQAVHLTAVPTPADIDMRTQFTSTSYIAAFGTFDAALEYTGIETEDPTAYARTVLATELHRIGTEFDKRPAGEALAKLLTYDVAVYETVFDSMKQAWRKARRVGSQSISRLYGSSEPETYRDRLLAAIPENNDGKPAVDPAQIAAKTPFSPDTYLAFFGTWDTVEATASDGSDQRRSAADQPEGPDTDITTDPNSTEISPSEIIKDLWEVAGQAGFQSQITRQQYEEKGNISMTAVEACFEDFQTAAARAGLEAHRPASVPLTWHAHLGIDLAMELKRIDDLVDGIPTIETMNTRGRTAASSYVQRFGSWDAAVAAVLTVDSYGSVPTVPRTPNDRAITTGTEGYTRAELVNCIRSLATELGHVPTGPEMNEHGDVSYETIYTRFGSWDKALDEAGLQPRHSSVDMSLSVSKVIKDVDGVGPSAAHQLEEAGYTTAGDIYHATEMELQEVDNVGPIGAERLLSYVTS